MDGRKINTEDRIKITDDFEYFNQRVSKALTEADKEQKLLKNSKHYKIIKALVTKKALVILLGAGFLLGLIIDARIFPPVGSLVIVFALASGIVTEQMYRLLALINNYSFSRSMRTGIHIDTLKINSDLNVQIARLSLSLSPLKQLDKDRAKEFEIKAQQLDASNQDLLWNMKELLKEHIEEERLFKINSDRFSKENHVNELVAAIFGTFVWGFGEPLIILIKCIF